MQKHVLCQKSGHDMPLDMICLNKTCANKGLLCHKCFMQTTHQHMSSDILNLPTFIAKCQENLDNKAGKSEPLNHKKGAESAREEYETSKKLISEYRAKAEAMLGQLFTEIEQDFSKKFETLLDEMEGPKNKAIHKIEKFRTYLKEMQSGLIDDHKEINTEMSNIWKVLEIDKLRTKEDKSQPANGDKEVYFTVRKEFIKNAQANNKPELVENFKMETDKVKKSIDDIEEWMKIRPLYGNPSVQKAKAKTETKDKTIHKNKENMHKSSVAAMNVSGVKRPNPSPVPKEKLKGSTPTKILKTVQANVLAVPESNLEKSKFQTPGRFDMNKDAIFMPLNPKLLSSQAKFEQPTTNMSLSGKKITKNPEENPMMNSSGRKLEDSNGMSSSKKLERSAAGSLSSKKLERIIEEKDMLYCRRLKLDDKAYQTVKYLDTHSITLKSSEDLILLGFKHFNAFQATFVAVFDYTFLEGEAADQTDDMSLPPRVLASGSFRLTRDEPKSTTVNVLFKTPVRIEKQKGYTIRVVSKSKVGIFTSYKGMNGLRIAPPFMFMKSRYSDSAQVTTDVNKGQIPEIIYTTA